MQPSRVTNEWRLAGISIAHWIESYMPFEVITDEESKPNRPKIITMNKLNIAR